MSISAIGGGPIKGFLHEPENASGYGVVLTHGAGGNCEMPLLVAVANALEAEGFTVLRCDLPFRQKRAFGAPSMLSGPADRAGLVQAVEWMRTRVPRRIVLGGQSYGGRQASILLSEQPSVADGLLLLSYPLHPPGKPAQLRTSHFAAISRPALFVQGSKDPFGTPGELSAAITLIPAPTHHSVVEQAGHDLARGKFDLRTHLVDPLFDLAGVRPPDRPVRA